MISSIEIHKLHDLYDYKLEFPIDQRVSIITGPNGYGKTTILKIISHLLECKFWYFYFLHFRNIVIYFRDGSHISIDKITEEIDFDDELETAEVEHRSEFLSISYYSINSDQVVENILLKGNYLARLKRVYGLYRGSSLNQGKDYNLEEILEREYKLDDDLYLSIISKNILLFLQEKRCLFIHEQRLINYVNQVPVLGHKAHISNQYKIQLIAEDLKTKFLQYQNEFALKSQEIDATFIDRLMNKDSKPYPVEIFEDKLSKLKRKIGLYGAFGLSPIINIPLEYPDEMQKVLSLYIDDMENKISTFDEFYTQLSLFNDFLLNNALSNKKVILDASNGISVVNDNGLIIPLSKLSSGEQNLLILYYEMIFTIHKNSLLLVDEPENSLHVEWLANMLKDYQEMAQKMGCQFLVATHSPVFVNGNWNITFDLFDYNSNC